MVEKKQWGTESDKDKEDCDNIMKKGLGVEGRRRVPKLDFFQFIILKASSKAKHPFSVSLE